jgi:general secretion pathway protein K
MNRRRSHKHIRVLGSNEGTALVAALWLSLILALLGIAAISLVKSTVIETKVQMRLDKAWVLAEGGVAITAYHIADARNPWRARTESYEATLGDEKLIIYVYSPQAQIDLNGAQPVLLAGLFRELGYEQELADQLGDRIADWRDVDDFRHLNGAESRAYLEAGLKYGPSNAPFKNVAELNRVLGIDANILACAAPYLTIYAPSGRVDPYLARGVVRRAAGLGDTLPPTLPSVRRTSLAGQVYEVQALAPISEHSAARMTAIIRFTGNPSDPVWRHRITRDVVPLKPNTADETLPITCPSGGNL